MSKTLEQLKKEMDAARDAYFTSRDTWDAARDAYVAYHMKLKETRNEDT